MTTSQELGRIPTGTALRRGVRMKCAVCGQGKLFRRWFIMAERCPRCDLKFERIEGHWLGALAVNTMVNAGVMFVALIVTLIVAYPEFPILPMLLVLLPFPILGPMLLFPVTRTFWMAMDLILRPPTPEEVLPEFLPEPTTSGKLS